MENLQKYLKHLPTCWTQQDYRELDDALAHTPDIFRDENWLKFYEDVTKKRNTCNCGYDETIGYYYPLPFIEWFRTIEFYNIFNEELHVNGMVWTTDDGKKFTTVKEIYEFIGKENEYVCTVCDGSGEYEGEYGPQGCNLCNSRLIPFIDKDGKMQTADLCDEIIKDDSGKLTLKQNHRYD